MDLLEAQVPGGPLKRTGAYVALGGEVAKLGYRDPRAGRKLFYKDRSGDLSLGHGGFRAWGVVLALLSTVALPSHSTAVVVRRGVATTTDRLALTSSDPPVPLAFLRSRPGGRPSSAAQKPVTLPANLSSAMTSRARVLDQATRCRLIAAETSVGTDLLASPGPERQLSRVSARLRRGLHLLLDRRAALTGAVRR